jgi:aryl-alcohol dehydrogenase-like predicted oxidoreductase
LFEKFHYGLVAFSPLLGGHLTGKYLDNPQAVGQLQSDKTGSITKDFSQFLYYHGVDLEKTNKSLRELRELAQKELDCDLAALALAWVLKYKHISSVLMGARNTDTLTKNLKALEVAKKLTPEIEGRVNKILNTHPPARTEWKTFTPAAHIRPLAE